MEAAAAHSDNRDNVHKLPIYSGLYKSIIQYVDIDKLVAPAGLPIGKETVLRFSGSLEERGFLRPVFTGEGGRIVDGVKRYAASLFLGYKKIPCAAYPNPLVFEDDIIMSKLIMDSVGFFEYAELLDLLTRKHLYTQDCVASALGRSQSFVANKLRLLNLTAEERETAESAGLTERHCRTLLRIKDPATRLEVLSQITASGMSVSAAEETVSALLHSPKASSHGFAAELRSFLKTRSRSEGVCVTETENIDGTLTFTVSVSEKCFT